NNQLLSSEDNIRFVARGKANLVPGDNVITMTKVEKVNNEFPYYDCSSFNQDWLTVIQPPVYRSDTSTTHEDLYTGMPTPILWAKCPSSAGYIKSKIWQHDSPGWVNLDTSIDCEENSALGS